MKFKYFMITAAAFLLGFSSCSSDDAVSDEGGKPKNVTVKIVKPSTYADAETAVGVTPDIYDAEVFFICGGSVLARGSMNDGEAGFPVKQFIDIPAAATEIIIVGNVSRLSSPSLPSSGPSEINTKAKLEAVMFEHSAQLDPETDVNLLGTGTITGTGDVSVNVPVRPAIARIEIGEIGVMTTGAEIPLDEFKLTGIYVNNTYKQVSLDYNTVPGVVTDVLAYGPTAPEFTNGSYPTDFRDEWAEASVSLASSFTPTDKWGYFIMPPVENKGTTIDTKVQTSIPHIVIKVEKATLQGGGAFPFSPAYLTITKLIDTSNNELEKLEPGKVYSIASVEIDGKDLTPNPETGPRKVTVTVQVQQWVNVDVEPGL